MQTEFLLNGVMLSPERAHQFLKPMIFVQSAQTWVYLKQAIVGKTEFRATAQFTESLVGLANERISSRAEMPGVVCVREAVEASTRLVC